MCIRDRRSAAHSLGAEATTDPPSQRLLHDVALPSVASIGELSVHSLRSAQPAATCCSRGPRKVSCDLRRIHRAFVGPALDVPR
eukprot:14488070-Alexandrium_andersonii.AAC.1